MILFFPFSIHFNIKSSYHCLDDRADRVTIVTEGLVVDHLPTVVEKSNSLVIRDLLSCPQLDLCLPHLSAGLERQRDVLGREANRPYLNLHVLITVIKVHVLFCDGLLRI